MEWFQVTVLLPLSLAQQVLQKFFPGGFFGEDREGHPVWYDNLGNLDFRGKVNQNTSWQISLVLVPGTLPEWSV